MMNDIMEDPLELSKQAIADLEEALDEVKNGRFVSHEEVKRRLNL
ncbi:MAG: hypothetical protein ACFFCS_05285 [Candidatus Hodarchaeota archaeon]